MQQTKKQLFTLSLALWALSSCSQDASDVQGSSLGGETVTFSLSAEVSVANEQTRAINYKLGNNAQGQLVPMPQFTDKQEVEVHTILKNSRGTVVAKTLKWRYDANKSKLVLTPEDGHSISVSGFNNDNGTKWYISGLIGGTLSGTKVTFQGTRELQGSTSAGDAVGRLEVPYAFAWTELTIDTQNPLNTRESNGSYKYAVVPTTANVTFAPQGSLIAYKLGNKQKAGAYTFTPSGFTVSSNAFGDQGAFELNTNVPTPSAPTAVLPSWTEGTPSSLVYSFASGEEPGTLQHESSSSKMYYAWVMPHNTQPTAVSTRVMLKGESSRPETDGFKDYTKTWFTDYSVKGSKLTQGKVHQLSANATHTYLLPIEYVTDYNLAGGEGLTYDRLPRLSPTQGTGITGELRFADSHSNDASGYYNWYKVAGRYDATYNPQSKSLQAEVDAVFGADKYYVPVTDQFWGVFPTTAAQFGINSQRLDQDEYMAFGPGYNLLRQSYKCDYINTVDNNDNSIAYFIRFKARNTNTPIGNPWKEYDPLTGTTKTHAYPSAQDNSLKCAYRYTRIGTNNTWNGFLPSLTNRVIVDVVYLGEEAVPTEITTISNPEWWASKQAEGLVISKTFPAPGVLDGYNSNNDLVMGRQAYYSVATFSHPETIAHPYLSSGSTNTLYSRGLHNGFSVRLFARRND